ncbi:rhomboid family intramembrane serine protease [Cyanobacteria bacterium FACHB-471]|nr:rhomboid family intramembrane serine protease [Cyanobacteria bacterium FACHB-471]
MLNRAIALFLSPMDLNVILIQLVSFSCILLLLRASRLPRGWVIVSAIILLVLAGAYYVAPSWAGFVSGGLWALLILLPIVGFAQVNRLVSQERYSQARRLAMGLRWLHPADGLFEYPQLLRGLELGHQGKLEEASQIFDHYGSTKTLTGRTAITLLYRISARWDELLSWVAQNFQQKALNEPTLAVCYLRALGETGNLEQLIQELERFEQRSPRRADPVTLNLVRMFALAFGGQPEQVQQVFDDALATHPPNIREFWLATAELAAGNGSEARKRLLALSDRSDAVLRNAIAWRLSHPLADPDQALSQISKQVLSHIATDIQQESRYGGTAFLKSQAYATYALIAANVAIFAVEIWQGGSEDLETLRQLGALVPAVVFAGEWWRLLTATFLHYGVAHLLMNMVGLYFLGTIAEASLGSKKFLLAYFFSGIGSMLVVSWLAVKLGSSDQIVVGASGAIMGLLGAIGAILLQGWYREKARVAAKRLRTVLFIIGLQIVFDLATPQVSFVGHISGLGLGFLVGNLLAIATPVTKPNVETF